MQSWYSFTVLVFFGRVVLSILARYLIFSGVTYLILWVSLKNRFHNKRIQNMFPTPKNLILEIRYSISTAIIFGLVAAGVMILGRQGWVQVYFDSSERGWGYLGMSVIALLFIHDSYFYWAHRIMHHPKIFKWVHRVHHLSVNPSPFTTYSFHPLEALVEAIFLPLTLFVLPLHPIALISFIMIDYAYNLLGHLGYEFYPERMNQHPIGKWINSSTAHNQHHQYFTSNYGLYFNFWDIICGTQYPRVKNNQPVRVRRVMNCVDSSREDCKREIVELPRIHGA